MKKDVIITKGQSNFIKLIAVITMLIDHIGSYLFPLDILRIIGRIAFPLFAYQIGIGYKMTSNRTKYLKRLFICGLVSQAPYYLLQEEFRLNILFTFILGIFAIWTLEKRKFFYFFLIIPLSFLVDYYLYGTLVILIFYFLKSRIHQVTFFSFITLAFSFYFNVKTQIFSILSFLIILKPRFEINLPGSFFYFFYPIHLAVIYLIKIIFL